MASRDNNFRPDQHYDRSEEFDQQQEDGVQTDAPDISSLAVLNQSEISQQVATAKRYPRNITHFRKEAMQLVALDEQTAAECIYALPRGGKTIEGPSARFAEIVNYSWGNTRAGARTISEEGEFVKSQGLFYDLEKNTAISYEVSRRITDSKGRRYNADMIGVTSNAACSVALRNAILKGIPKAFWKPLYDAARRVVAGDIKTLVNRREEAIKEFAIFGVTKEMICATLRVDGVQDIGLEQLVVLKGIMTAIKDGDTTPEQAFAPQGAGQNEQARNATDQKMNEIKNRYPAGEQAQGPAVNPPQPATTAPTQTVSPAPEELPQNNRTRRRGSDPNEHGVQGVFQDREGSGDK